MQSTSQKGLNSILKVIGACSAIIAAILTGVVTYKVENLKTETEKIVTISKQGIERAKLFQNLIQQLKDEETAHLALIVLWNLYPEPRDRKTIILAAFEVKKDYIVKSLIRLEKKDAWDQYLDVFSQLKQSDDPEVSKLVALALGEIKPIKKAQFLIDVLSNNQVIYQVEDIDLWNENIINLIDLTKKEKTVKDFILNVANKEKFEKWKTLYFYILYRGGEKSHFLSLLKKSFKNLENSGYLINFFCCGDFEENDWNMIDRLVLALLKNGNIDRSDIGLILMTFERSGEFKNQIDEEIKKEIVKISKEYFLNKNTNEVKARALKVLKIFDPREALFNIARQLAKGEESEFLRTEMEHLLNWDIGGGYSLKLKFSNIFIPDVGASKEIWKKWLEDNHRLLSKV